MKTPALTPACEVERHDHCMGKPDSSTMPCNCVCHFGRFKSGRWIIELEPTDEETFRKITESIAQLKELNS
jgi:hypothetical protein